jgi:hypothetical protein
MPSATSSSTLDSKEQPDEMGQPTTPQQDQQSMGSGRGFGVRRESSAFSNLAFTSSTPPVVYSQAGDGDDDNLLQQQRPNNNLMTNFSSSSSASSSSHPPTLSSMKSFMSRSNIDLSRQVSLLSRLSTKERMPHVC